MVLTDFCTQYSTLVSTYYTLRALDKVSETTQTIHVIVLPTTDGFGELNFAIGHEGKWYFYCPDNEDAINTFNHLQNISKSEIDVRILDILTELLMLPIIDLQRSDIPADFCFNISWD